VLDEIDKRILRTLQVEGRITNQDLAERCHLSPPACHERFKRLRESGYIDGFSALLNPRKLERGLLIFVEVVLERTTKDIFDTFAQAVRECPEVLDCFMVAGGFDYLIKLRVRDMDAYRVLLGTTIVNLPGVRETRTYSVLEEVKSTVQLPIY
jgi:Lrp/AsnC family leucine-responsive transcriptional regulator